MGLTGTELQPALQLANTPQRPGEGGYGYVGLGWCLPSWNLSIWDRLFLIPGNQIHMHAGGNPGYSTWLAWDSGRKVEVVLLANARISTEIVDGIGYQLTGEKDLLLSDLIFELTAIAFMLLLAVLLVAQKKRRVKTTWVVGILWLLLAAPLALVFSCFLGEGRGAWTLLPLSLILLYMLVKALLDFVLRIDFRRNRITRLATLALMCLALFNLIWIAFGIHPSWGTPVLIPLGSLWSA